MTKELVDKVRALVEERRTELENANNPAEIALERLIEIGYLDKNGEVTETYGGKVPAKQQSVNPIV